MAEGSAGGVAGVFRALADPTRLRILVALRAGEVCVGDLVSALRLPQPTVSRHLAYLRKVGLVACRRDGLWCHYALAPAATPLRRRVRGLLDCCAAELPAAATDAARMAALKGGGCCPAARPPDEEE